MATKNTKLITYPTPLNERLARKTATANGTTISKVINHALTCYFNTVPDSEKQKVLGKNNY
jgi:hypothetical protein